MMKYSVAVIAGGTIVWPQMRMMRLNSRMTIVLKPTTLVRVERHFIGARLRRPARALREA